MSNQPTIRIAFEKYQELSQKVCCVQLGDHFMSNKGKSQYFRADSYAFTHEGEIYLPTGHLHTHIEKDQLMCQRLVPADQWEDTPTFSAYRDSKYGYYVGTGVTYRGELFVMAGDVGIGSYLPGTTAKVDRSEAQAFQEANQSLGWRFHCPAPRYEEHQGAVIAIYKYRGDRLCDLHYRDGKGGVDSILIKSPKALDRLIDPDYQQTLSAKDQLGFGF